MRLLGLVHASALLVCLGVSTALGQFGHPLKGSWSGDWGPNKDTRTRVLIVIDWDGMTLSGTLNPGPDAVAFQKVDLNPETWSVRLEGEGRDLSGNQVRYVIEGKLENLGAYRRFITGTWTQGSVKGEFRITRN